MPFGNARSRLYPAAIDPAAKLSRNSVVARRTSATVRGAIILLALAALCWFPAPAAGQVVLQIDPAIDQSRIDFDLWNRTVVPLHDSLSRPYPLSALSIHMGTVPGLFSGYCGDIRIEPRSYPAVKSNLADPFYKCLTHEYGHAKQCYNQFSWAVLEGEAESQMLLTYRELAKQYPAIPALNFTRSMSGETLNNLPMWSNPAPYPEAAFAYEQLLPRLAGSGFSVLSQAVDDLGPVIDVPRYMHSLDSAATGLINGRRLSTSLLRNTAFSTLIIDRIDGTVFCL
jgi:hypothetical protein